MSQDEEKHDWVLIAKYDTMSTYIDRRSVRYPNGCVRVLVRAALDTPGTNKITGKQVVAVLTSETFDLKSERVKVNEGLMIHDDGSAWPLENRDGTWGPVQSGTIKIMEYLRTLGRPLLPSDLLKRRMTPAIAMGIVNPMGPTLCGICLVDNGRRSLPEVVRFSLNPFSQEAVALRFAQWSEALQPAALLEEFGLGTDAAGTLLMLPTNLPANDAWEVACLLGETRTRLHREVQLQRKYPGDPWKRVAEEMRTPLSDDDEHDALREADIRDYATYILDPEHWKQELGAFAYAWEGSIQFQRDQGSKELADAAMPPEIFKEYLIRLDGPAQRHDPKPVEQSDPAWSTGWWKSKSKDLFKRFRSKELQTDAARPFDPKAENIEAELARCLMNRTLWSVWDNQVLLQLMHAGLVFYGASNDGDMVQNLYPLYKALMERTDASDRMGLYKAVRSELVGENPVTCNALMPFLIVEDDRVIVSTAVLDFVLLRPAVGGDTLVGVREVMRWLEQDLPADRGATLGGLVMVGDRRIHEIVEAKWSTITSDEISVIAHARTGFPNVSTFEFWLRWMERLIEEGDDALFGYVASGLRLLLKDMSSPGFVQGLRPLGAGPRLHELPPSDNPEILPVTTVAERFSERMYTLENNELPPKVMSHVLKLYGLEPRAPLDQQYVIPERQ